MGVWFPAALGASREKKKKNSTLLISHFSVLPENFEEGLTCQFTSLTVFPTVIIWQFKIVTVFKSTKEHLFFLKVGLLLNSP